MALPPYEPGQKESRASRALTLAIGAIVIGVSSLFLVGRAVGLAIVLFAPVIGITMLVCAGFCIYWLTIADETEDSRPGVRAAAVGTTILLVILGGLVAVAFIGGIGGIYK